MPRGGPTLGRCCPGGKCVCFSLLGDGVGRDHIPGPLGEVFLDVPVIWVGWSWHVDSGLRGTVDRRGPWGGPISLAVVGLPCIPSSAARVIYFVSKLFDLCCQCSHAGLEHVKGVSSSGW